MTWCKRVWYGHFQVPSEAFRLGRTRVFFKAGQISTLQKILNETPPEKGPWVFQRLQEALANRQRANATAAEANVGSSLYTSAHSLCPLWMVEELVFFVPRLTAGAAPLVRVV